MISASQVLITGGSFTNTNVQAASTSKGFELLVQNVAPKALHNSGEASDPTTCHPDTRVAILTRLEEWACSPTHVHPIIWLRGSAGVGKTAIMRTIAEILEAKGYLLADFFFWRTGDRCNTTQFFIPTLAYQIATSIPETRSLIEKAIEDNPLIFTHTLGVQMQRLIIAPIKTALEGESTAFGGGRILVIDGLDECQGSEKQLEVLKILYQAVLELPSSIAILIASRPESHIRSEFDTRLKKTSFKLMLNAALSVHNDIKRYYVDKFHEIKKQHPLRSYIPPYWPSYSDIDTLVQRASGQFIYASTIIRFVSAHRKHPARQLDIILQSTTQRTENPFHSLDSLYITILSKLEKEDLPAVLQVLGSVLTSHSPIPPPNFWDRFLGFPNGEVKRLLVGLESLLTVQRVQRFTRKRGPETFTSIQVYHASLQDFLFDPSRSGLFFINRGILFEQLAKRCIHLLFTPDVEIQSYILTTICEIFQSATPTAELHETIEQITGPESTVSCSQGDPSDIDPFYLRWMYPRFLTAIGQSKFADVKSLYLTALSDYQVHLRHRLAPYLKSEWLTFFIIAYCLSGLKLTFTFKDLVDTFVDDLPTLKSELINIDKESGFNLYESKQPTITFMAGGSKVNHPAMMAEFRAHVERIVSQFEDANGNYYYIAALHLVKCMCMTSEFYTEGQPVGCYALLNAHMRSGMKKGRNRLHSWIIYVLPKLLGKVRSAPGQSRLADFLRMNPILPYYREDPWICKVINQYIAKNTQKFWVVETWIGNISRAISSNFRLTDNGLKDIRLVRIGKAARPCELQDAQDAQDARRGKVSALMRMGWVERAEGKRTAMTPSIVS